MHPPKEINITKSVLAHVYYIMGTRTRRRGTFFNSLTSGDHHDVEKQSFLCSEAADLFFLLAGVAIKKCRKQETCETRLKQGRFWGNK